MVVRAAKSGPDYIDPAFHAAASGAPCVNLDSWAMPAPLLDELAARAADGADLLIIESAMGLFDGVGGVPGRSGSAADLAARYALPVLLVLDVSGQSQSAAAVARGFDLHHPDVRVAGVILNRVASERHRAGISEAMQAAGIAVFGAIQRDAGLVLPERHLGLVQAAEHADLKSLVEALAGMAEEHFDLDAIWRCATTFAAAPHATRTRALPPPGHRIALARDAAFSFIYPHLLQGWRQQGAEISTFSPLADEEPPDDCDACWLPGGYPELHAARLAQVARFRAGLIRFAETRPVHGECGGHMVLGQGLEDEAGRRHPMLGLLGHSTSFALRRLHLGYREATLREASSIGAAGDVVRGHEFHYAQQIAPGDDAPLADLADAAGRSLGAAGGRRGCVTGTFFHAIAQHFADHSP